MTVTRTIETAIAITTTTTTTTTKRTILAMTAAMTMTMIMIITTTMTMATTNERLLTVSTFSVLCVSLVNFNELLNSMLPMYTYSPKEFDVGFREVC